MIFIKALRFYFIFLQNKRKEKESVCIKFAICSIFTKKIDFKKLKKNEKNFNIRYRELDRYALFNGLKYYQLF